MIEPSNACKGSTIISKANVKQKLVVKKHPTVSKMETLKDILQSGNKEEILVFLANRNIFDPKVFNAREILWMLKDKAFYEQVMRIMEQRQFYDDMTWQFAWLHNDMVRLRQLLSMSGPV